MWLALISAGWAQSETDYEVGLGATDLIENRGKGDPRLVVRALRGPVALELSGSMSPWAYEPSSLNFALYSILGSINADGANTDWSDLNRMGDVRLVADIGVPTLQQAFCGSPHLYVGAEALRYRMESVGMWVGDIASLQPIQPQWSISPLVGAGVQAYVGPVSIRVAANAVWEPTSWGTKALNARGSWDLLYRF